MDEPDEEPAPLAPVAIDPEEPVYCPLCAMWLNGPTQMTHHEIGKKHKKNRYLSLHEFVIMFIR